MAEDDKRPDVERKSDFRKKKNETPWLINAK